jgi:hypothetical protein
VLVEVLLCISSRSFYASALEGKCFGQCCHLLISFAERVAAILWV